MLAYLAIIGRRQSPLNGVRRLSYAVDGKQYVTSPRTQLALGFRQGGASHTEHDMSDGFGAEARF